MSQDMPVPSSADWQDRQKLASFYQTQVGLLQQGAIAFQGLAAIMITLGIGMAKLSGVTEGQDWFALLAGVLGWLALAAFLNHRFAVSIQSVTDAYETEHRGLFPEAVPYQLESYLRKRKRI